MAVQRLAWSWADSASAAVAFQREAARLVGDTIERVVYLDVDYSRLAVDGGGPGVREVDPVEEWDEREWEHAGFDSVDFGLELTTAAGRVFTISWEQPGVQEGIGLREFAAVGTAVAVEARSVAVWDVTTRSRWAPLIGRRVDDVRLHYEPWDESRAVWCPRITITFGSDRVELLLAEFGPDHPDAPMPSADNVVVMFSPASLPEWLTRGRS